MDRAPASPVTRRRCRLRAVWAFLLSVVVLCAAPAASAAGEDAAANATVDAIYNEDYAAGNFGEAKRKLDAALEACRRGCTGPAKSRIHVMLGMIASQLGNKAESRAQFTKALQEDPNAQLPQRATPDVKSEWAEVKKSVAPSSVAAGGGDAPGDTPDMPAPTPGAGAGAKIPGWTSVEAFQEASAALAADLAGKIEQCIEHNKRSLEMEEQPRTRLHLASCEARIGKLLDALRDAQKALEVGIKKNDQGVMKAARERVQKILPRIPHVTFTPPSGVDDLVVTFDDRPVPAEALTKKFSIDPGHHTVHAEGTQGGIPLVFDHEYSVREAELLTVTITLKSQAPEYLTPGQLRCMLGAKNQEDVIKCLPQNKKNLVIKAGLGVSGYSDTNHVFVYSPEVNGSVASPTAGWNVGGSFLIDVVSAASPDIVSEASPPFKETRYAGTLYGGYKPGKFGVTGFGNVSREPDYLSMSAGAAVTGDFRDKLITPRLGVSYRHDTIGRGGTSFDVFSHSFNTTDVEAGATFILSPTSLILVSTTVELERGDQSKPYRYIPMFDPVGVAPRIPAGATVDLVNRFRLPLRPLEQLPTERNRYALGARFVKRLGQTTLRLEERVYNDTWNIKASTTDLRYVMDLSRYFRVWPHFRFHGQTAANFYQLAYSAQIDQNGIALPLYRSSDRELSPLVTITAGGGTHIALTGPDAKTQFGVSIQGDVMYTRFFNALFVTQRTAVYGSLLFDAEFD